LGALLPKLLERAGNSEKGSITGLYTVLVEGDDLNDPVADTARSILDGHIILSRDLANRGQYPAIDPTQSISRVMPQVVSEKQLALSRRILQYLAVYKDAEDLINIGAYVKGSNPTIDQSIAYITPITNFLKQNMDESLSFDDVLAGMVDILKADEGEKS
jgi:flagellum-specific ATP synthase